MLSTWLIPTAVLLCLMATTGSAQIPIDPDLVKKLTSGTQGLHPNINHGPHGPHFHPFCYCKSGYVFRSYSRWPYCRCYKFVRDVASWAEAREYCQVLRANMMEVKDYATQSWLQRQLSARKEAWTISVDSQEDRSSRLTSDMVYSNWIPGEPNNYLGYQNCLAIKRRLPSSRSYGWFDDDCYQKKFYICERRGWYCWGWSCWRRYLSLPKCSVPPSVAIARRASSSGHAGNVDKVTFEA
ncbi:hypothetical protein LSAT2_030254 [Lamellibrachia satsuma]|nr:hypothetical protein LSAT2_030254 [Lamellibrachia satsuma]